MSSQPMNVRMRCSSWSQLLALHKRDISRGQLFLKAKKSPSPGTALKIQLLLPSGNKIEMTGVVSVVLGPDSEPGPGAVVALDPLTAAHRMTLDAALAALAEQTRRQTARGASVTVPAPAGAKTSDPLSFDAGQELVAAEDELLLALKSELATLSKLNPFQILGVGYGADDDAVRLAFGELSKRYHPDRFVRYQSEAVGQLAEELFVRAREAFKQTQSGELRDELTRQIRRERKPRKPPPPALLKLTSRGRSLGPTRPQPPSPELLSHLPTAQPRAKLSSTAKTRHLGGPLKPANKAWSDSGTSKPASQVTAPVTTPASKPSGEPATPAPAPATPAPAKPAKAEPDPLVAYPNARGLLDSKRFTDADGLFGLAARRNKEDAAARAGIELAAGLRALEEGDRLEAAQRFEAVLDLHPANEVAARELANMRRRITDQRRGLLAKLMKDNG